MRCLLPTLIGQAIDSVGLVAPLHLAPLAAALQPPLSPAREPRFLWQRR
jgi:hypothetical protein